MHVSAFAFWNEAPFHAAVQPLPFWWVLNDRLQIAQLSPEAQQRVGNQHTDWTRLLAVEELDLVVGQLNRLSVGEVATLQHRLRDIHGQWLFLETTAIGLPEGQLRLQSRDLSPQLRNERRLWKLQHIIDSAVNGIAIIDIDQDHYPIRYHNRSFLRITGGNEVSVQGRPCLLLQPEEGCEAPTQVLRDLIARGEQGEVHMRRRKKDGGFYWCRVHLSPVPGSSHDAQRCYTLVVTDNTFEKIAEEKLKEYAEKLYQNNEELQTFAYVASHDLQEPLRTIASFSELLAQSCQDQLDEEALEYLGFIMQGTERMRHLIQDLLEFSRVSTGKVLVERVDLRQVVESAMDNLRSSIQESGAEIHYGNLPILQISRSLVLQVFQNLLSNAIKYRHEQRPPQIRISCTDKGHVWEFCISDNGIGIQPQYYDRIFVIFQRLHTHDRYSGTGLGLAICKKIIEKYGGRIWVNAEQGQGSRFYFTLPKN